MREMLKLAAVVEAAVVCAVSAAPTLASDTATIHKGDVVYIAASLKQIEHPRPMAGATVTYDIPPCKKFTVTKAEPKKNQWTIEDAMMNHEQLEGPWLPRMFRSEEECKAAAPRLGEGNVTKAGLTFTLRETGAGAKN
jgi:hypothetical protein